MTKVQSLDDLKDWDTYRDYLKEQLKLIKDGSQSCYISKDKVEFEIKGKPWKGYALLVGKQAPMVVQKLLKERVVFREGTVTKQDKSLAIEGLPPKCIKGARLALKKLVLGFKIEGSDDDETDDEGEGTTPSEAEEGGERAAPAEGQAPEADQRAAWQKLKARLSGQVKTAIEARDPSGQEVATLLRQALEGEKAGDFAKAIASFEEIETLLGKGGDDLAKKAERIEKAVVIWNKTEQAATEQLRKLQKAIMALDNPRSAPVIKGLQGILTRLDKIDDEAIEAAQAAERGDAKGFAVARADFQKKLQGILNYVQNDELIRDADSNPEVKIKIQDTLSTTLNKLLQAV